jgi:hypothetical protein
MRLIAAGCLVAALALSPVLATAAAPAQDTPTAHKHAAHKTHRASRHWHGYGFLPGYRPPEVIARQRAERYWASGPHWYGPAWPRYYRGRWNGGGFGPCYQSTPIGYMWTCGR